MWNELAQYRNHFLQKDVVPWLKPVSINRQQEKEWNFFMEHRQVCRTPFDNCTHSTYFDDRAQLAYGWFALPKLMRELDSDSWLTHWRAIKSLSEFLLNPLHCERALNETEIVRKTKNAFMRIRLHFHVEEYNEIETLLDIYNILSRTLTGAEQISRQRCLIENFYAILNEPDKTKHDKTAEILRNLTSKPKVLGSLLEHTEYYELCAQIFTVDECRPRYPAHLWHHLTHYIEHSPERGIELGLFETMHKRIANRLLDFADMTMKTFALLLRCVEGQKRFDDIDGIRLLYNILNSCEKVIEKKKKSVVSNKPCEAQKKLTADKKYPPMFGLGVSTDITRTKRCTYISRLRKEYLQQFIDFEEPNFEYVILALQNGLHSKRALWRAREFTTLPNFVGELLTRTINPRLQLYCIRTLRELAVMPCIKRFIVGNWLRAMRTLHCLNAECECARDEVVHWLRRDINEVDNDTHSD